MWYSVLHIYIITYTYCEVKQTSQKFYFPQPTQYSYLKNVIINDNHVIWRKNIWKRFSSRFLFNSLSLLDILCFRLMISFSQYCHTRRWEILMNFVFIWSFKSNFYVEKKSFVFKGKFTFIDTFLQFPGKIKFMLVYALKKENPLLLLFSNLISTEIYIS